MGNARSLPTIGINEEDSGDDDFDLSGYFTASYILDRNVVPGTDYIATVKCNVRLRTVPYPNSWAPPIWQP
jgi:hypothetical protein